MMQDCKNDNRLPLDQIKHPVRVFAEQGTSRSRFDVDDHLSRGLRVDTGKGDPNSQKESFGRTNASSPIPAHLPGDVRPGLWCQDQTHRYMPCCLRISASATAQGTLPAGFCR